MKYDWEVSRCTCSFSWNTMLIDRDFMSLGPKAMSSNRLILAVLFLVFGLLSILPIIWNEANFGLDLDFVNIQYSASSLPVWEKVLFSLIPLVALCGSTLLFRNSDRSKWCCIPVSAMAFWVFPLGSALSVYYFWYLGKGSQHNKSFRWTSANAGRPTPPLSE